MDIILQEDFPALGYVGDKVKVKRGFARNYLIPRGLAVEATSANANYLKHVLKQIDVKKSRLKNEAEELGKKLEGLILEFNLRAGAPGKTFGAVTIKDLETEFSRHGFNLNKKQIRLPEPIRKAGEHKVHIKLHSEVISPVTIRIFVEGTKEGKGDSKGEGRARKAKGKARGERAAKSEGSDQSGEENPQRPAAENETDQE